MKKDLSPCLQEKCSFCCDPVKVSRYFPDEKIPRDKNGKKLWEERRECLVPESDMEKIVLRTFRCVMHDRETGLCKDYDHRPEICRGTSCIHDVNADIQEQCRQMAEEKFFSLKS